MLSSSLLEGFAKRGSISRRAWLFLLLTLRCLLLACLLIIIESPGPVLYASSGLAWADARLLR